MKLIPLSRGKFAKVDDADFPQLSQFKWYARPGYKPVHAQQILYAASKRAGAMHRVLLGAKPRQPVDHKDGDGLNNQRENLRHCTPSQNRANSFGTSPHGFKGICMEKNGKWRAGIKVNGKRTWLGVFPAKEDAARAYDTAAIKYFGEFARLNFPELAAVA